MVRFEKKDILIFFIGFFLGTLLAYFSFWQRPFLFFKKEEVLCRGLINIKDNFFDEVALVVDGDTLLMKGGYYVRLLGINADEKNEKCYKEAKERLTQLVGQKKVLLKRDKEDKDEYCRYLRHVFLNNENVALKLLEEGLVVTFFLDKLKKPDEFLKVQELAKKEKRGCQWKEGEKKIIPPCEAKNFLNQKIITEGKVISAYRSKNNNIFLNLERPYPRQCLTLVIFSGYLSKFSSFPEKEYFNKKVRVEGIVQEYEGKAEIILKNKEQIEIID